ncbi:GntR family transcriptional regulator [Bacillus coahuilensis p1.1.43]|uniref:GntR family transcriptional regulator n=1 Tax=Bacillus coahuilensis p1.1.43 TaxID=1150625 RepID=A0A147K3Y6_9BACI|nr:GntR family transcriptional regulator [Bacillus coahuilensis]KUP04011.1 GntR family transcriptional regulator [Bacillus coahuilensis p1.1.43]
MFELDIRSRKPIYEQLVEKVKELIISGALRPDEKLPSVRSLSKDLTVNPNTIQKAYRELEHEGFVYSLPGKGSYVSLLEEKVQERKLERVKEELTKLINEALYLGLTKEELLKLIEQAEENKEGGN